MRELNNEQRRLLWLSLGEVPSARLIELQNQGFSPCELHSVFQKEGKNLFSEKIYHTLSRLWDDEALNNEIKRLSEKNVRLLFWNDPDFPETLKQIQDPPYLLYCAGTIDALAYPCIGIVGTRRASRYGKEMSAQLASGFAKAGLCVVSGLAHGIDAAAHQAVLEAGGVTVGILGSGLNVPYPADHLELMRTIALNRGLILTEYPLDSQPLAFHFPHRNRLISGLSRGIVFVEGQIKSGGMSTVNAALTQGREVFAVPGQVGTFGAEGPNAILREGARIVTSAADVLEDLGIPSRQTVPDTAQPPDDLTGSQRSIFELLKVEPLRSDEIEDRLGLETEETITDLAFLEIIGLVIKDAGNQFRVPTQYITGRVKNGKS